MKYPLPCFPRVSIFTSVRALFCGAFCWVWLVGFTVPQSSEARIGERQETIERRLANSGGIRYRDDAIEQSRRKGMPYTKYLDYLTSSAEIRIYFKTTDGRQPASSELEEKNMGDGWDLHVVYVNGKSVIEVYKRSRGMTTHEFNNLLALQAGGSFWRRLEKQEQAEAISAFDFDMVRDDGRVRAKKVGGDSLLFVDSDVDTSLAEMNESDLQSRAPVSVEGF